ncbi:MAG: glycerol acyltransferase [Bacteroidales bacterium]|nr:glycerol acyltransferase [Bacteroidales bacterium]MBQ6690003.1 glycerol acyltransferase [Bacteroidales bacterium]
MTERQPQILDLEQVIRSKAGSKAKYIPKFLIRWFGNFMHLDYINGYLKEGYVGVEFCENCLKYLGVDIEVNGLENLPKDGRRLTFVSNHPLGAIDGVTLGAIIGRQYDGKVKYLLNDLLMNLKGMAPLGIPVNKLGSQARNLSKLVNEAYDSDNQMLIFPAGLCSRKTDGVITDLAWGKSFVKKSRETGRDIIPIHFEGENSKRFYRIANLQKALGLKFNFAMMLLPDEMYRSTGRKYRITFGKPIPIETLDSSKSDNEWAQEIRKIAYGL